MQIALPINTECIIYHNNSQPPINQSITPIPIHNINLNHTSQPIYLHSSNSSFKFQTYTNPYNHFYPYKQLLSIYTNKFYLSLQQSNGQQAGQKRRRVLKDDQVDEVQAKPVAWQSD
jgi:hypothetical protein